MNTSLTTQFWPKSVTYTGAELRPHFLLSQFQIKGSAVAAFIGPCRVETSHLVDLEDQLAGDRIEAREMVHFIGEFFGMSLREAVILQRLFMATALDTLQEMLGQRAALLRREGDDLYFRTDAGERKLSVSIVTATPVSQLLHVGINIDPTGAPVPAIGLGELKIDSKEWISKMLQRFSAEWSGMEWAAVKVRPVL